MEDTYYTISKKSEGLYKEKGSKFIAMAFHVTSEDQVKDILHQLRKDYYDARHHCYAYVLGFKGETWRANDDGEPSSTAGKPIHGQIVTRNLTNVLVVVIRYFGGTKLGVSGLIHAYKTAAFDALSNADIIVKTVNDVFDISFSFSAMNEVMKLIKDEELKVLNQKFDNQCTIKFMVRQSKSSMVLNRIEKIDSASVDYIGTE